MSVTTTKLPVTHCLAVHQSIIADKPFTHCYQCRNSAYELMRVDDKWQRKLMCRPPHSRGKAIDPEQSIGGCRYAARYNNADFLSNDALDELDRAIDKHHHEGL